MLCDIGNGTMNIMFINDRRPAADRIQIKRRQFEKVIDSLDVI